MFNWLSLWSRGGSVDVVTWLKRAVRLWDPPQYWFSCVSLHTIFQVSHTQRGWHTSQSLLWNGYWEFPLGYSGRGMTLTTRLHQSVEVTKEWSNTLLPVYALVACTRGNWPFQIPCKHAAKMTFRSGVWTPVNVREFSIYYIILY